MRPALRTFLIAATLAGAALSTSSCADNVPTESNACPCANGYVCCGSGVCAADEASCGQATAALSIAAQGKWVGYIENFTKLPSGTDKLVIELRTDGAGQLTGSITFGEGAPPAPPTVANQTWPLDPRYPPQPFLGDIPWAGGLPIEGVAYTARDVEWRARRLRMRASFAEPWGPWCALQTSYSWPDSAGQPTHGCLPVGQYAFAGNVCTLLDGDVPLGTFDAGRCALCGFGGGVSACDCTETGCVARAPINQLSLDLDVQGNEAEGSLAGFGEGPAGIFPGGPVNVRLIRASR